MKDTPDVPLSPLEIAQREERRQAVGTAEVSAESEPLGSGIMSFSGPGSWTNQACGVGLDGPVSPAELGRLVAFYASRGVQPQIEVCPFAHESLVAGLGERGFVLREFENVLARELDPDEDLQASLPRGWPAELELDHVDPGDPARVREFVEVSTSGFRAPDEPISEVFFQVSKRVAEHPRSDSFLARWAGEPVGGGGMETTSGVACLFGTSVFPSHRRRGIQAALIVRRLEQARLRGCNLAVIHSRPGIPTERNAARVGFAMAYTKVVLVQPRPDLERSP